MKRKIVFTIISFVAVAALSLSCCAKKASKAILNGLWFVQSLNDNPIEHSEGKKEMTLVFDTKSMRFGGMGICNSYGGDFQMTPEGAFTVSNIISTRVGCEGMGLETSLFRTLEKSAKIKVKGDKAELYDAEGTLIVVLQRQAEK